MKICPVCSTEYPDDIKFCQNDGTTLRAAAPATNLVGQVIADRYHVVKKLGEGGMGQVYLAEHVKMGRRSAIKVMNPSLTHDPDAVARFNREAANASRITHPNVCAVYDFGETPDGLIYLAMEFVEGEPLTDVLVRDGALPLDRTVRIFQQVADALQAAHDLGIVHRDLKPDNIMLAKRRDGADVVKVVDFGIAKAVGGDDAGQKVTKTGLVVGTPEFMSPEQLSGDKLDGRSDLYSLALVFFRMVTGKLPFEATTVQETMIKRLTDEPMTLAASRPDLAFPAGLQAVLDVALSRSPVDRYQSAAKFAADVVAVAGVAGAGRGPAIPATLADTESKTQLLDAEGRGAGGGGEGGATRAMAARRKRSLVPIVVGTVVVLGGGGAAVAALGGHKADGGTVRSDSASQVAANHPDSGKPPNTRPQMSPTGTQGGASMAGRESNSPASSQPRVDSAEVDRDLGSIIERTFEAQTRDAARHSARAYYDNLGVPRTLRAQAAFVVANAFFQDRRNDDACTWNELALRLSPANESYLKFQHDQRCGS